MTAGPANPPQSAALRLGRTARVSGTAWPTKLKRWTERAVVRVCSLLNVAGPPLDYANPLKIEVTSCHFAGVVSRQTSSANIRSYSVDRTRRRDAYVSHKRRTAITAASHAAMFAIDIRVGDSIKIGVTFQ
jgi:hypothetical protein